MFISSAENRIQHRASSTTAQFRGLYSDLVEIFLWEKNLDAAWLEAQKGGCSDSLWLTLAERTENDYPEDAVTIYKRFVEPTLARKNNESYQEAIELLSKISKILKRLDRKEQWKMYVKNFTPAIGGSAISSHYSTN